MVVRADAGGVVIVVKIGYTIPLTYVDEVGGKTGRDTSET